MTRLPLRALTVLLAWLAAPAPALAQPAAPATPASLEYRVVAGNRASTLEREINDAALQGFAFGGIMGSENASGGSDVAVVMVKHAGDTAGQFEYRVIASRRASAMQKEIQEAAAAGFEPRGQTAYKSAFAGKEVTIVLERDKEEKNPVRYEYRLLATKKPSTMQKELSEAAAQGFDFVAMTLGDAFVGGVETITILRRPAP